MLSPDQSLLGGATGGDTIYDLYPSLANVEIHTHIRPP
jgi:hypothetical protein